MPLTDLVRYLNARNRARYQLPADAQDGLRIATGTAQGRILGRFADLSLDSAFQPIIELRHGRVVGHEALLRARSDQGCDLSPEVVFVLPTDAQEIVYLDRLARTVHALNFLQQPAQTGGLLYLNVHPRHLLAVGSDHGLVFEEILRRCGLSPDQVVMEILESEVEDLAPLKDAIANFRSRGYRIAIDDFGRGHANLDRVWELAPDIVKLDRRLIATGSTDRRIRAVLPKLVDVLKAQGAQVLFEGIENPDHLDLAHESGADLVQGYLLGRPAASCRPIGQSGMPQPEPIAA